MAPLAFPKSTIGLLMLISSTFAISATLETNTFDFTPIFGMTEKTVLLKHKADRPFGKSGSALTISGLKHQMLRLVFENAHQKNR